ncbi:unnamed protein product [Urochloa humidicola]
MADPGPPSGSTDFGDAPGRVNDPHVIDLARFAVSEHNQNDNDQLEFQNLVHVKQRAVAGAEYLLTIEAKDGEVIKLYEAKVWDRPWMDFKQLLDFKLVGDSATA